MTQFVELPKRCERRLLDGARAFPPEDCGGEGGYYVSLVAVGAPKPEALGPDAPSEEELEERREWLGDWAPEAFNLAKAKRRFDG